MKIAIAGGTGLIGQELTTYLVENNHEVYILTRQTEKQDTSNIKYIQWLTSNSKPEDHLEGMDAIVNFAGTSIFSGRWTEKRKSKILKSRIDAVNELHRIISMLQVKPNVFVNASAIGFYGTSLTDTFTESDAGETNDFLAYTTHKWEEQAQTIKELGIRTVLTRLGIVLSMNDGALPKMVLPYQFFGGGKIGTGNQWMSWIHIRDVVRLIGFAIENPAIEGPINATAPNPVKMDEFGRTIAKIIKRPHWLPVPTFALKMLLGEMSQLIVKGQRVLPQKACDHGFTFEYEKLENALKNLLKKN